MVLGYDWERYQKDPTNEGFRRSSLEGLKTIIQVHDEFQVPLTIYVVGRMLEYEEPRELLQSVTSMYTDDFLDIQQHTYSHTLIKDHAIRGKGISLKKLREEITKASRIIEETTGRKVTGMHSAQSFYQGMQGEKKRLRILWDCGIRFISSDGRGLGETSLAPWKDQEGNFRQPYFYKNEGCSKLLEIPNQGYSDNFYRGLSNQSQMKIILREEIEGQIEDMRIALENNLLFAPAMHLWVTGLTDIEGFVIKEMLEFAKENKITIVSAKQLYEKIMDY